MLQAITNHAAARSWYATETKGERQIRRAPLPPYLVARRKHLQDIKSCRSFTALPLELQLGIIELLDYHQLKRLA